MNKPLLVPAFLVKCWWSNLKPEDECVCVETEVALTGQQVQTEEAVIPPALSHLKIGRKLTHNVLTGIS